MKPSGWGIALRILGVLSALFAGVWIIGIVGSVIEGDYSGGDVVLASLIFVAPPLLIAILLFRAARRRDNKTASTTAESAAARLAQDGYQPADDKDLIYKGQSMHTFGWLFLIPFGIGVLWDLANASAPGPIATAGTLLGAFLVLRGRWWLRKKIVDEDAIQRHKEAEARAAEKAEQRRQAEAAEATRRDREGYNDGNDWRPPKPSGTFIEPWGKTAQVEVVGEYYRTEAFISLLQHEPGFLKYEGAELRGNAVLVPDPNNPYGKGRAVAVYFRGQHIGYLFQSDANKYFPTLNALRQEGKHIRTDARVWGSQAGGTGTDVHARATIWLPNPAGLTPSNELPEQPHTVLPAGKTIQVTKEDEHMDVLANYVKPGAGNDNYVAATLRSINEIRPRSSYEAVQVEIDGQRIGVLTKAQSEKLLPLVRYIEQRGRIPVARATVKGTKLKAEVVLNCVNAETVDDHWLDRLGPATTQANIDKTVTPARPDFDWDD